MSALTLTKSLHTVTAVSRLALYLHASDSSAYTAVPAVQRALTVLGYDWRDYRVDDPTLVACITATKKLLS